MVVASGSHHSLLHTLPSNTITAIFKFKSPSHHALHVLLEKCSTMKELKFLHAQIILHGLTAETLTLGKLISFCAVSDRGDLRYAQFVFDRIPEPNKFMYNCLIRGYSNSQEPVKAIFLYRQMLRFGHFPNEFTLPFVLKACSCLLAYWEAVIVHAQAIKLGIGLLVCLQNALLNVYVACGFIGYAREVFDRIPDRTLVSWNSMIGGYSRYGCIKGALSLFREMRKLGIEPDEFTFVNLLSVCSHTRNLKAGSYVHSCIEIYGVKEDIYVRNALVDMYAKCGYLQFAERVFDRMHDKNVVSWTSMLSAYSIHGLTDFSRKIFEQIPEKNAVSWNSMISCLVQKGECRDALDIFSEMCLSRVQPDEATFVGVLSACSQLGDLVIGEKTHNCIINSSIIPSVTLYNSLIDMYSKCGPVTSALEVFSKMPEKNLVSWNVILGALALHGYGHKAIEIFENMQALGIWPDKITFTGLLSACSHSGLVETGQYYFDQMYATYQVSRDVDHYACMVDLLGRGGFLGRAVELIKEMPMKPDLVVWGALLGACRIYGNVEIGKQILKQLLELEPFSGGLYVLISNIFVEAQRWEDVKKIRILMKDRGIKKTRALSSIEVDGRICEFMVDDKTHKESSSIYLMLDQLTDHLRSLGCLSENPSLLLDVEKFSEMH